VSKFRKQQSRFFLKTPKYIHYLSVMQGWKYFAPM
jgi:hypothetical protein